MTHRTHKISNAKFAQKRHSGGIRSKTTLKIVDGALEYGKDDIAEDASGKRSPRRHKKKDLVGVVK